ncbi:MAG: glutamate--tRNA ligase [Acidimicrobiales bacterium]
MPAADVRVRFAPSPTGYLHIGGARTALFNWLFARHTGGEMLLRIEDTDAERSQPELIEAIFTALDWLGIDFDGEPVHQSDRLADHVAAAERLLAESKAYRCDCTQDAVKARNEQAGGPPGYDGFCRDRDVQPGPGVVVRFRTPDDGTTSFTDLVRGEVSFENANLEDFVIVRSSGLPMFLVANAVDDAAMGITHIIRGEDLINVTPKVLLLRQALGIDDVPVFAHLPLIVNEQRKKLSKRRDDVSVGDYIDRGYLPEAMVNYLATLGWGAPDGVEIRPLSEIIELFRLEDVNASSAFFDLKKLAHFNGEYIRALPVDDFIQRSQPWLHGPDAPWAANPEAYDADVFAALAPLVQERVKRLDEVPGYVDFLFLDEPPIDDDSWQKVMVKGHDRAVVVLDAAIDLLADTTLEWAPAAINDAVIGWIDAHELSRSKDQAPIRVAVTGRTVGPPLWESLAALGRERTLDRLRAARARL